MQVYNHCEKYMRKQNFYIIYDDKNDYKGQSYIEYGAYAYNEDQVRDMAEEMGRQYECKIFDAVVR